MSKKGLHASEIRRLEVHLEDTAKILVDLNEQVARELQLGDAKYAKELHAAVQTLSTAHAKTGSAITGLKRADLIFEKIFDPEVDSNEGTN